MRATRKSSKTQAARIRETVRHTPIPLGVEQARGGWSKGAGLHLLPRLDIDPDDFPPPAAPALLPPSRAAPT